MANQNIIVSNDVFRQPERFQIRRINGTFVCEVGAYLDQPCRAIKQHVSSFLGMCKGKFRLVAGLDVLCDDLYVHQIMNYMQHTGENIIVLSLSTERCSSLSPSGYPIPHSTTVLHPSQTCDFDLILKCLQM